MRTKAEIPGRRERKLVQLGAGVLLLMLVVSAGWYLTSRHFENWVRHKVIAELQAATGGRVEIGTLRWTLARLEIDIHDLTVHGREPASMPPYAHVDHLVARLKVLSLFSGEFGFRTLIVERPVIHITVGPDGTTNQPTPVPAEQHGPENVQRLFELGIERADISQGELVWNDRHIPLDLVADDVIAQLLFVSATAPSKPSQFDGFIKIGKLDSAFRGFRPFSSSLDAEFSLMPRSVELRTLRWQSGDSRLTLKGGIADLSSPQLDGEYDLQLNLRQAAEITRTPQLRQGTLQLTGKGSFSPQNFAAHGNALLRGVEWSDPELHASGLNLHADFSANPTDLVLSHIAGNALGGGFSGEATWRNWRSARGSSTTKVSGTAGAVHLDIRATKISQIARTFSNRRLRLEQVPFTGDVSGKVNLAWKESLTSLETVLALAITASPQSGPGTLPVSGEFHGRYQISGHRLEITSSRLATPSTVAIASGNLGFDHSALNLNLKSTDGSELQSLLSTLGASDVPLELRGPVSFLGVITGKWNAAGVNAHVELADFDLLLPSAQQPETGRLQVAAKSQPPHQQRMHFDRFSGDVHVDPSSIAVRQGELQRGKTKFDLHFSSSLHRYKFADADQFSGAVAGHGLQVDDLQSLAGVHYPVTGTANFDLQFSGTRLDPRAQGAFQILTGSLWGTPFKSLRSQINLANRELQLNDVLLSLNGARVNGTASYNLDSQGIRFQAAGEKFDLAHVAALNSDRFSVEGEAAFQASGSWILNTPFQDGRVLNLTATLSNLVLNGERQGDLHLEAETHGQELRLRANSQLELAALQLDGTVQLRDLWPADITLNVHRFDYDPLLRAYLKGHITGHSSAEGSIHLFGPLRDVTQMRLTGEFPQLSAEIESVKLNNQGPIRLSAADGILQVEQMHIVGEGTDFSAQGSVPLLQQAKVALNVNGQLNLKVLQGYYPGLISYGSVSVAMKISGTWQQPTVGGQVEISNAGLSLIDLPNGLSEIKGTLVFNQNRLYIRSLTARTGGGDLKLGGFIAYSQGIYFDLAATGSDVRLRYPPGISAEASADLRFVGSPSNSTLSGEITVNRFTLTPSFDFGSYLASKQSTLVSNADSPLSNIHFAVHIVTRPELQVQSSLARVSGDADLNLRGTLTRPVLLGRINISSGDVFFNGTKYHLERGDMLFVNPLAIEPIIDVAATTRVRDYDITLGFHGPLNHLAATYRSDPPLPTADVITLLALGRTRDEQVLNNNPQSSTTITESAANAVLGQALNYAVSSRVQRLFGASRIKIDPRVGEPGTPNARLTVEQAVSTKVTVTYITNLSQSAQQVVQVEVQLNPNLSLVGVRDQYGVLGFDFRIRQRKR